MTARTICACLALVSGCGDVASDGTVDAAAADSAPGTDGTPAPRTCDPTARFGAPTVVPGLASVVAGTARLTRDELTLVYSAYAGNQADLFVARRDARDQQFSTPQPLTAVNTASDEFDPAISADGLRLWFSSSRGGGGLRVFVATRPSTLVDFGAPGLATVNAADPAVSDAHPFEVAAGTELWFTSSRPGGQGGLDLYRALGTNGSYGAPSVVAALSSPAEDWLPSLSADGLTLYFTSTRTAPGTKGGFDIWRARRAQLSDPFSAPALVDELNTAGTDYATWLSDDNCRMYGYSDGSGAMRIYMASRQP